MANSRGTAGVNKGATGGQEEDRETTKRSNKRTRTGDGYTRPKLEEGPEESNRWTRRGQQENKLIKQKTHDSRRTTPGHRVYRRGQRLWSASFFLRESPNTKT